MSTNNTKKIEQHKIGVSDFEKAVRGAQTPFNDVEWNGLTIHIRHQVTLEYMMRYVDYVVNSCFDGQTGEYRPEIKDFAIRSGAIKFFTNIELPEDVSRQYRLMYGTDIISVVMSYVDAGQMNSMLIAIDKKLDYAANANIEKLSKQFEAITDAFEELSKNMENMFGSISVEDVNKIASAIAGGAFDENKLVKAVADAKFGSTENKDE